MSDPTNRIPADADAPVETLYEGRWLSLRKRGRWEYAERNNPGGAVIILAVTPEDMVLFVEQYRVSILQNTIEMPAGLVGDVADHADESALLAAQRELEEETGYRCQRVEFVHRGPSSSGMSTEMITFVRAWDLERSARAVAMNPRTSSCTKYPAARPAHGCLHAPRTAIRSIQNCSPDYGSSNTPISSNAHR